MSNTSKNFNSFESALIAVQTGIPVLLWGEPGIGKTYQITQFANFLNKHLEVVIASNRDPTDFLGFPKDSAEGTIYSPPKWALKLSKAGDGILFLDEVNWGSRNTQAAMLRVVNEKEVGECKLPKNTWIIAASNPPEKSGGSELLAAFSNRFLHFDVDADLDSWRDWLIGVNRVNSIP